MRDFLSKEKGNLKFVYSVLGSGDKSLRKVFKTPMNYEAPNNAFNELPEIMGFFSEFVAEATFPEDTTKTIGEHPAGTAGDWINSKLKVAAAEIEIDSQEASMGKDIEGAYR